jgi:uncharacterized protein YgiM (DUF1202 family)
MKKNYCLFFGALLTTSLVAQPVTNAPPAGPAETAAADTNAPAAKGEKKKAAKKAADKKSAPKKKSAGAELRTVPLIAGPAVVIASNVNVRGQAKLNSEVITRLNKGQPVTVIEEVTLKKSGPDEPSAWAKIALPPNAHAWVHSSYIASTNKTVVPKKLKLRGGPGEEYSVLGILKRGDAVKEVSTKGDWMQIEAPAEAYAFVAAQYLKQEPAGAVAAAATTPEPAPTPTPVTEPPTVAAAPTDVPAVTNEPPPPTPTPTPTPAPPAAEEPPPKRIVQREGLVRGTFSIQAPTHFELVSPDTGKTINYLYTTSVNLDLQRYKGMRIIVTGEEGLDERWRNTPVITIQKIQVLE